MSWILGLGGYSHDASACLLHDGQLVAAVQEERLSRIKHDDGFPRRSIRYCLDHAGIGVDDVDTIAFYAKKSNWDDLLWRTSKLALKNFKFAVTHPKGLKHTLGYRVFNSLKFRADFERFTHELSLPKSKFAFYHHHACHAASTFYGSPFDQAIVLCVDSVGDGYSTSGWLGQGNNLKELPLRTRYPNSIAHVYNRVTKFLGFRSTGDEYKVMGLAAYGSARYLSSLRNLIIFEEHGNYRLNPDYFRYEYAYELGERFYKEFGFPREPEDAIEDMHADMAASVQALFEEVVFEMARKLKESTGVANLCMAGGAALNSKCNGVLLQSGEFDSMYVPPGASDVGAGIGAAQYHWHEVLGNERDFVLTRDDWGPQYSEEEIQTELDRAGIDYAKVEAPATEAAKLIADGRIVGWFQGRMEFGPRALGNRSILADARDAGVKDRVNSGIKYREEFRPFAPSILREAVADYFQIEVDCPFMTYVLDITPSKRDEIPGVVHADGTGRLQTVAREEQPLYWQLIHEFSRMTDVPLILNTSFNLAGEPIVASPFDALRCFYTCGMDALFLGSYLVKKPGVPKESMTKELGQR